MAELSKELYGKLLLADSQEEVTELLKAGGREDVPAQEVWEKVQERRTQDGMELSPDELEDVAGGRDWMAEGCAATVETNSDCWGTDPGRIGRRGRRPRLDGGRLRCHRGNKQRLLGHRRRLLRQQYRVHQSSDQILFEMRPMECPAYQYDQNR